jgi:hypothetical protein
MKDIQVAYEIRRKLVADEHTRWPMKVLCSSGFVGKEDLPIDSLSDIPITTVNALLFNYKLG